MLEYILLMASASSAVNFLMRIFFFTSGLLTERKASVYPYDFHVMPYPIGREINPAAVSTELDLFFDHLLPVYFKLYLIFVRFSFRFFCPLGFFFGRHLKIPLESIKNVKMQNLHGRMTLTFQYNRVKTFLS